MAEAAALASLASRFLDTESGAVDRDRAGQQDEGALPRCRDRASDHHEQLEPGAGIPEHTHEDLEQTYIIEGSLVDAEAPAPRAISSSAPRAAAMRRSRPTAAPCWSSS